MVDKSLISKYITPLVPVKSTLSPRGRLIAPVRAVIFDIYGTLFVSASGGSGRSRTDAVCEARLLRLIAEHELPGSVEALLGAYRAAIAGRHAELRACGVQYPEVDIEKIWQQVLPASDPAAIRRFALKFEFIVNPVYPMPKLKAVLGACARRTVAMGIVSNAQFYTPCLFEWLIDADLDRLGFDPELVLLSYRFGRAKPSLELFEECAERLGRRGIRPTETLFVGNDMLKDIYPAQVCGFQTALYAGDKRSLRLRREDPRCSGIRPELIVTELDQLTAHLSLNPLSPKGT